MSDIKIRPAADADLGLLIATFGDEKFFTDRLARQKDKRGTLLTARLQQDLIGSAYLWLEPADELEIREHLPGVPLLNRIEIRADHRGRGHGTELIRHAEQILARSADRVALAVRTDNFDAYRLYERMGYVAWDHPPVECMYEVELADGTLKRGYEKCDIMVKQLRDSNA
jgi:ribosomal protein S18 acetylase RimI-like enzyme